MDFEWDPRKNADNVRDRRIPFTAAIGVFQGPRLDDFDGRFNYGEDRWVAIGLAGGRVLAVVYTERGTAIRIISARKATNDERQRYEEYYSSL